MVITKKLKEHLVSAGLATAGGDDDYFLSQARQAIGSGALSVDDFYRLNEVSAGSFKATPELQKSLIDLGFARSGQSPYHYQSAALVALKSGKLSKEKCRELMGVGPIEGKNMNLTTTAPSVSDIADTAGNGTGGAGTGIRVKRASERYSTKTTTVINKMTGQPMVVLGSPVETPSEASFARIGAWFKHYLRSRADILRQWDMKVPDLSDHEKGLLEELYHEGQWCGVLNQKHHVDRATLAEVGGLSVKALLDDATSGGQTLVPYEFDTAIVRLPYLHSQILPLVDLRTAGSSEVKTGKMGQVSVSWGTAEGTAISLFNTDSLITEIAVPILACSAAMEWGKDFQMDTPVADFGSMITDEFGQAMLSEIDRVICEGNGTTEPEGFLTASGTVSVNSDNGVGGPWTLGDFIEALFSVPLQYRELGLNGVFISNDTTFMRSRQIKVDTASPSTDQRPVMSTVDEVSRYTSLGFPHKISNTGMSNSQLAFLCAKKYRLYRRTGIEMLMVDQDWTLARQNKRGLIIRSRMGGKLVDGNACAKITDGES